MNSGGMEQYDKVFKRLMSKERSTILASPSFRVYYGGAGGSVPFEWESRPGTPKHPSLTLPARHPLPPLTPPPSFYFSNHPPSPRPSPMSRLFNLIAFPLLRSGRHRAKSPKKSSSFSSFSLPSSPSPLSSFRSSSSLSSMVLVNHDFLTSCRKSRKRSRFSSFDSSGTTDSVSTGSPTSTLCFGIGRTKSTVGKCYMW